MTSLIIRGNLKSRKITIPDTATKVPTTPLGSRVGMVVQNNGNVVLAFGGADVTFAQGILVDAGDWLPVTIGENALLYAIADTGQEGEVRIMEGQ